MTDSIVVRPARLEEIDDLTGICMRSKAHWGYDAAFMRNSRDALTVKSGRIAGGDVLVAELAGEPVGVAAIAPDDDGFEIELFFVDPGAMGHGVGTRLFRALAAHADARGISRLIILSDPNAAPFYEKMGARKIGSAPSESIPGRSLPLYEIDLGN